MTIKRLEKSLNNPLFSNKRFRAAYDFLLLREQSGEKLKSITTWWTQFQISDEQTQAQMIDSKKSSYDKKKTVKKIKKLQVQ